MRHSLNIVVALLSMAAGAWQGTTAHSEQPAPPARRTASGTPSALVLLRGCVEKGAAPGTFLLVTPDPLPERELDPALHPAEQPQAGHRTVSTRAPRATKAAYEIVAGAPGLDLARLVGKQVEAHGTAERTAPGATASESAAAAADTPAAHPPAAETGTPPRVRVRITSVGHVAGPCE